MVLDQRENDLRTSLIMLESDITLILILLRLLGLLVVDRVGSG